MSTRLLEDGIFFIFFLGVALVGVGAWTGHLRTLGPPMALGDRVLALPWMAGGLTISAALIASGALVGNPTLQLIPGVVLCGSILCGLIVSTFHRPAWAVPRWYREEVQRLRRVEQRDSSDP